MDSGIDHLRRLLDLLKTITFWQRLFSWKKVKILLIDASADVQKLVSANQYLSDEKAKAELSYAVNSKETENLRTLINTLSQKNTELQVDNAALKQQLYAGNEELNAVRKLNAELNREEAYRKEQHATGITSLKAIQDKLQAERALEIELKNAAEIERINKMKETWQLHQASVKNIIKGICNRLTIEYVEKVPFKGEPDNTIKIAEEYVVFDAKSPAGEELNNFPAYIKDQAEKAKKYARQDGVKTEIFLVVPVNTLPALSDHVYSMGDYTVYVISVDAIEPMIVSLKRIEAYEFAEQLNPDDRENICRIIGKFAHLSKRRIQVDSYFARQFIELAYKCETGLPPEILEQVIEFERSEKLNPPIEKRAKQINLKDLDKDTTMLTNEIGAKGIATSDFSDDLNKVPLYTRIV